MREHTSAHDSSGREARQPPRGVIGMTEHVAYRRVGKILRKLPEASDRTIRAVRISLERIARDELHVDYHAEPLAELYQWVVWHGSSISVAPARGRG